MGSSRVQVKCPSCSTVFLPSVEETQSRAGASARRKGHAFERRIAKLLQDWWNQNGQFKYEFRRTPQSGGSALKQGWGLAGDIATTAQDFLYHVECKNAPGSFAGLHQFLSADKFKFWEWLEQCNKDCPPGKRILIVFNRFDQPTWCGTPRSDAMHCILDTQNVSYLRVIKKGMPEILVWKFDDMIATSPDGWKSVAARGIS
jgi:hypothetical protein